MFNSKLKSRVEHLTNEVSRLNAIIVKMTQDIAELRALSNVKNVPNPAMAQQELVNNLNNALTAVPHVSQQVGAKTTSAPVTSKNHDNVESTKRNRYRSNYTDDNNMTIASIIAASSDNTVCGGPSSYSSNDSGSHSSHSSHSSYSSHDSGSSYSSDCGSFD
jgi:hypothetical protein